MYYSLLDIVILKFCCSVWRSSPTLWDSMDCSTSGFPVLHSLKEFVQIHVHWVGDAIHPSHPLSPPSPSAFNLPQHQGSFPKSLGIRWPKHWNFSFSISPSNEYSALISFRIDWFDPLAVQQTLKNVLQHQSLKASIFWHSVFIMVQIWHPCMTTGKTTALTMQTFVGKVMSLFFSCWLDLS